jgi:hypothetical protein
MRHAMCAASVAIRSRMHFMAVDRRLSPSLKFATTVRHKIGPGNGFFR